MGSIKRIKISHKNSGLKQAAQGYYDAGDYQKALESIEQLSNKSIDPQTRLLQARVYFRLGAVERAKEAYLSLLSEENSQEEVLRELIDLHEFQANYHQVLHYLDLLFLQKIDHTREILQVLGLYRKLGMFDRAAELFSTLNEKGFFSEVFLEEKTQLFLDLGDKHELQSLLTEHPDYFGFHVELYKRVKRELKLAGLSNAGLEPKNLYFRLYGKILLGSFSDNGEKIPVYSMRFFDEDHFYETCLRFVDFHHRNRIQYLSVHPANPEDLILAEFLAKLMDLPFDESPPKTGENKAKLVVHRCFDPQKKLKADRDIYHLGFILKISDDEAPELPEFAGVLVESGVCEFYFDSWNGKTPKILSRLYSSLYEKAHISSLSAQGREALGGFCEFTPLKSNITRLSSPHGTAVDPKTQIDKLFAQVKKSFQEEKFLYLKSFLESLGRHTLSKKQVGWLLSQHQERGFPNCDLPSVSARKFLNYTYEFYFENMTQSKIRPELFSVLNQVPHRKTLEILTGILKNPGPYRNEFISSLSWVHLRTEEESMRVFETEYLPTMRLCPLFQGLTSFKTVPLPWISILKERVFGAQDEDRGRLFDFFRQREIEVKDQEFDAWLKSSTKPEIELLRLMIQRKKPFPTDWIPWLRTKRGEAVYVELIEGFLLEEFLLDEWEEQKNDLGQLLLPWSYFGAEPISILFSSMGQSLSEMSNAVKQEVFLCFLKFSHRVDFVIQSSFVCPIFKESMKRGMIAFLEQNKGAFLGQDLLFLMDTEEHLRIQAAAFFLGCGDMEFFGFLMWRFKTHGAMLGPSVVKLLFQCRADQASRAFIDFAVLGQGFTLNQCLEVFNWIESDDVVRDEWMILLASQEMHDSVKAFRAWFENRMKDEPQLLRSYLSFFPQEKMQSVVEKYFEISHLAGEKLQILRSLDSDYAKTLMDSLESNHREAYLLRKEEQWE
jgi:hypothetical protein